MANTMTSALRSVVRNWSGTPAPSFQLRQASQRWSRFGSGKKRRTLRVVDVVQETPTTSTFVLEPLDREPFEYLPGQHLILLVEVDGTAHRRCYSFSTAPGAAERPAITVKHIPDGRVSGFLTRNLAKAQTLRVAEASGVFTVKPDVAASRRFVMIAGGVGITPLISMTEAILRGEPKSRVTLLFGNRSADEIIFRTRIASLEAEFPKTLEVVHCLDGAPSTWTGATGQLGGAKVLELLGQADRDAHYLVCGPGPMMDSVVAALAGAGIPKEQVRLERFEYVAPATAADHPTSSFKVRFAKSGAEIRTVPNEPILTTALGAGVALDYSCQMGGCGACKVKTTGGKIVIDKPNCLTPQEIEEGYALACCSYAAEDIVVESH